MGGFRGLLGASIAGLLSVVPAAAEVAPHAGRTRYPKGWRGGIGGNPAGINRWTGQRHEHAGEIARRERQAERVKANRERRVRDRYARGQAVPPMSVGVSRRGSPVFL